MVIIWKTYKSYGTRKDKDITRITTISRTNVTDRTDLGS